MFQYLIHTYYIHIYICFVAGYKVVQHAGDFTGFAAQVYLMPDVHFASFSAMNFPDNGVQRQMLHAYISDIVLEKTPWFNLSEVCNYGSPAVKVETMNDIRGVVHENILNPHHKAVNKLDEDFSHHNDVSNDIHMAEMVARHPLTDYVGEFGNFAYGNVSIFLNAMGDTLHMTYGRNGNFYLESVLSLEDVFRPVGIGSPANLFSLGTITFGRSTDDNTVRTLLIPAFESLDPPEFIKGLKQSDAPPPAPC